MSTKRKRESDEALLSPVASKVPKQDEVTRSGRVRKKPAKFTNPNEDSDEITAGKTTPKLPSQDQVLVHDESAIEVTPDPVIIQQVETVSEPVMSPETVSILQHDHDDSQLQLSGNDDEDTGKSSGRRGRTRKKSAKVLEMEEFEEAEKKQYGKKGSVTKVPHSPVLTTVTKMKSPPSGTVSGVPVTAALAARLLNSSQGILAKSTTGLPPSSSGIQIQTVGGAIQTTEAAQKVVEGVQQLISPQKGLPINITPDSSPPSGNGQGSVIKLLLSSPAQNTGPTLSTMSVTSSSPPQDQAPASVKKKTKPKAKCVVSSVSGTPSIITCPGKQDLAKLKLALGASPQPGSPVKLVPLSVDTGEINLAAGAQTKDMMKMKFILSPKVEGVQQFDEAFEISPPIKKEKVKDSSKPKKAKKVTIKEPKPHKVTSPVSPSITVAVDTDIPKKKKGAKVKQEVMDMGGAGGGVYMEEEEYGLDLEEIPLAQPGEETLMDMEESDSLMISEDNIEPVKTKVKSAKKKVKGSKDPLKEGELVMDFERMKSEKKGSKKKITEQPESDKGKKKRAPTAYMLWCNVSRPKLVKEDPKIDFSSISKRLGEMWSTLSEKDKLLWKRKAKKVSGKGSTLITTGKGSRQSQNVAQTSVVPGAVVISPPTIKTMAGSSTALVKVTKTGMEDVFQSPSKGFGIEPVDVASHLKILGESLGLIGMRLQEHRGMIAVQGSLSVLLDSLLCACAPLMCLTSQLPETNGCSYNTHMKTLDNIGYIMPGL